MKVYTLGFIFTSSLKHVLLINKKNPLWQRGKLNGLGGVVEQYESTLACVVREVKEESNLNIPEKSWIFLGKLVSPKWSVEIFTAIYHGRMKDAISIEEEQVEWVLCDKLPKHSLGHLFWLVPLAKDAIKKAPIRDITITYR